MMNFSQRTRLQAIEAKPWSGIINYFRLMKADWDALEALGYVTTRLVSAATYNGAEVWEYAITNAGRQALEDTRSRHA